MYKLKVTDIKGWPKEVLMAYYDFKARVSPETLNEKEREEYDHFSNENRKLEYLLGRSLFKNLLKELDMDPADAEIQKEEKGKPYAVVNGEILQLSFTHSAQIVMCAMSRNLRIGLDIEFENRKIDERVVKRILSEKEWEVIGYENPLKLWTIKEAALKCSGHGLQSNLNNLAITQRNNNSYFIRFNNDINYEICSFKSLNHQIALAYQSIHS